ncbi:MAG: Fe-S cluster assembly protein SufD, partial [Rhodovibrionaceae bacterium]
MAETTTDSLQPYLEAFARAQRPAGDVVGSLRDEAIAALKTRGLPSRRDEAWKYTRLKLDGFLPGGAGDADITLDALPRLPFPAHRLVFVNGHFRAQLSDEGLGESLAAALPRLAGKLGEGLDIEALPMAALNTAFFADGLYLKVTESPDKPIHLVSLGVAGPDAPLFQPRNLIAIEGGKATLIESQLGLGGGPYAANSVTEIAVGENATLTHITLQDAPRDTLYLSTSSVRVAAGGGYNAYVLSEGAALSRNEIHLTLAGEGASCRLDGAYLQDGTQHCDITTSVTHAVPDTTSREVVKGALDGKARGVFQGKILVSPDAQRSDGRMMNKTLLLSDKAEIDTKPELEIYADDVLCAHGATAGELDDVALFYLRSRGIPENKARRLLIES